MNFQSPVALAVLSLIVIAVFAGIATRFFSPESRLERRRRRNNQRVISKARRPGVVLSARTKKRSG
jgi:hypothetical protein